MSEWPRFCNSVGEASAWLFNNLKLTHGHPLHVPIFWSVLKPRVRARAFCSLGLTAACLPACLPTHSCQQGGLAEHVTGAAWHQLQLCLQAQQNSKTLHLGRSRGWHGAGLAIPLAGVWLPQMPFPEISQFHFFPSELIIKISPKFLNILATE